MEEFNKIELPEGLTSTGLRAPRGISVSRERAGNYYDAEEFAKTDPNHHIPVIEELHVIADVAPFMLPQMVRLVSNTEVPDSNSVMGFLLEKIGNDSYRSELSPISKTKKCSFVLVRIEY